MVQLAPCCSIVGLLIDTFMDTLQDSLRFLNNGTDSPVKLQIMLTLERSILISNKVQSIVNRRKVRVYGISEVVLQRVGETGESVPHFVQNIHEEGFPRERPIHNGHASCMTPSSFFIEFVSTVQKRKHAGHHMMAYQILDCKPCRMIPWLLQRTRFSSSKGRRCEGFCTLSA